MPPETPQQNHPTLSSFLQQIPASREAKSGFKPEYEQRNPTEEEQEAAYIAGEFVNIRAGYVLLADGTHARILSFHDDDGQKCVDHGEAKYVCANVNGMMMAYALDELLHTLN